MKELMEVDWMDDRDYENAGRGIWDEVVAAEDYRLIYFELGRMREHLKEVEDELAGYRQDGADRINDVLAEIPYLSLLNKHSELVQELNSKIDSWVSGTIGSPHGLEGIAGMRDGMVKCSNELKLLMEKYNEK